MRAGRPLSHVIADRSFLSRRHGSIILLTWSDENDLRYVVPRENMKKEAHSESGWFTPRVCVAVVLCSVGGGLAVLSLAARPAIKHAADSSYSNGGVTTAAAPTFTVNSTADVVAAAPLDNGICETVTGNNVCTLRAAIMKANHYPGGGATINFGLAGVVTYSLTIPASGADNEATGDLNITSSVSIIGRGPISTIIDGNGSVTNARVLTTNPGVTVIISGVTIQHGKSSNFAGGIANSATLTLANCTITNNTVSGVNDWGGGILNSGTFTMTNSTVSNNTTGNSNAFGGGIYNQGPMTVTNSTISGNTTLGQGGGLNNVGNTATIRNSTISGNTAVSGGGISKTGSPLVIINSTISGNFSTGDGGGIFANSGTTSLHNVTVTLNRANSDNAGSGIGGGIANAAGSTFNFVNSIIALNEKVIPTMPFPTLARDDCSGVITSQGHNIMLTINSSYCTENGTVTIADPNLSPLQNNGGPTQTAGLLTGSPAIDTGTSGGCTDNVGAILTTDQRGASRPFGSACDIGAFEAQPRTTLANISTRLSVQTGDNVPIAGFIVTGTAPKRVIVRALGPSLNVMGVPVAGRVSDTTLELIGPGGQIALNDNWRSTQEAEIIASTVPPPNNLESAIIATLPASAGGIAYTAIVRGAGNATGVGQLEVYDLENAAASQMANISTRGLVLTGDNVMIGGIILVGPNPQRVIVRALGPSLTVMGTPLPGRLMDTTLEIRDANGMAEGMNDEWRSTQEAEIIATTVPPPNDLESAIVVTLPASAGGTGHTAIVRGKNNATGVGLMEVFALN